MKKIIFLITLVFTMSCKDRDKISPSAIEFSDVSASNVQVFSAQISGSIAKTGGNSIIEHGFVFSNTNENPTIDEKNIKFGAVDIATPTPIEFSGTLSELQPKTDYYVRSFATIESTTIYSKTTKFTTSDVVQPTLRTDGSEAVTHSSAKLTSTVTAKGTYPISEYGIVWGTAANPGTDLATKSSTNGDITQFPAGFSANATGLTANTTYNFRAFVVSNGVTSYGENKTFKTAELVQPGIRTDDGPKVGENTATAWGTVTSKGSNPISEYGICWNTAANPTTANSKRAYNEDVASAPKQFDALMENLNPATTYHFRAYVIMGGITTYGDNKSFTTSVSEPKVTTGDVFSITGRGTVITGTVSSQGSYPISEIGIVYGPNNNPTTSNTKLSKSGAGVTYPHNYEFTISGFSGTGEVYFRAYVISNGQTYYGASKLGRTLPPGLSTSTNSLSGAVYTLRGILTSKPTLGISEYGIVWANSKNSKTPTTAHNKLATTLNPNTTTLIFPLNFNKTVNLSTLGNCQAISYRVYCITSDGVTHYATNVIEFGTPGCIN